jgi:hypothetical protein
MVVRSNPEIEDAPPLFPARRLPGLVPPLPTVIK